MAPTACNLKVLLNITLWILIINVKTSIAGHYSDLLSSLYKQTSNQERPLILVLDNNSNRNDRDNSNVDTSEWNDNALSQLHRVHENDWDKRTSKLSRVVENDFANRAPNNLHRADGNNLDDTINSAVIDKNDIPYPFLYLYKIAQQVRTNSGKNTKLEQNSRGSYFSSAGTHKIPNWDNQKNDNRYRNKNNEAEHFRNNDRDGKNNGRSKNYDSKTRYNNISNNRVDKKSNRNNKNRNPYSVKENQNSGWNNKNLLKDEFNRNYNNIDKVLSNSIKTMLWDRNLKNIINNNKESYHGNNMNHGTIWDHSRYWHRYNDDRYPYNTNFFKDTNRGSGTIDHRNNMNRLTNQDKELIQLENNILESPFVKTLLKMSNDLALRQNKKTCDAADSCAEDEVVTEDPCDAESNSCDMEESTNISTRGAVQDYVSDPPPQMC